MTMPTQSNKGTPAPRARGGLPLPYLGHALEFHRNPVGLLQRSHRQLGDVFSFPLFGKKVTVLLGPKAHETYFRAPDSQLSPREAYQFTVPIFGKGIAYDTTSDQMSEQLGFVFPALREERLQAYARVMQEEAENYFDRWPDAGEVDLLDTMNELTTFIASRTLIGQEFRDSVSKEFAHLYQALEGGINMIAFFKPYLPTPTHRRRDKARVRMAEIISQIIQDRRHAGRSGEDFLQTLMTAHYKDGTTLTDDNITGILLTLIFAGQHTSSVLATWVGVLLLQNRRYLPPILKEQEAVFGTGDVEITLDRLKSIPALERSILEAERMHPPLIMLLRTVMSDFDFGGYRAEAGGLAMVSPAVAHRMPAIFANPDVYDPMRFAAPREEHKQSNYALIGFGGGKHRCIGMTFAYQQLKAIWSVLLQRFDLELAEGDWKPDYATFVVGPRKPCGLRFRRRLRGSVSVPAAATAQ